MAATKKTSEKYKTADSREILMGATKKTAAALPG